HGDDPDVVQRWTRAQLAAHFEPVHSRHHQIEQHDMRPESLDLDTCLEPVTGDLYPDLRIARANQLCDEQSELRIVVNNQHALGFSGAASDRGGAAAAREFLNITQKKPAMSTRSRQGS